MKRISLFAVLFGGVAWAACLAADTSQPAELASVEKRNNYWCTFLDALGNPIPGAKVQIFRPNKEGERTLVKETTLDDGGNLKEPPPGPPKCSLTVSHPDYGLAQVAKHYRAQGIDTFVYYVPLVRRGCMADKASIWGVVLDPDNQPVAGAKIYCGKVETATGLGLRSVTTIPTVITDPNGRFRMHLPIEPSASVYRVPPRSKYEVAIDPPVGFGLIRYHAWVTSGQESTIVLDRAEDLRTFVFEDANGPITDLEKLKVIRLCVRLPGNRPWYIHYPDWKEGRILPLGTFEAGMYSSRVMPFEMYEFEPIEVTTESPQQLVFKVRQKPADKDIVYTGRVIHGLSGEPMAGAFVAAADTARGDFSWLTNTQWQKLHQLASSPAPNEPALEPLRQIRPVKHIVQTDKNGWFEMTINAAEEFDRIVVFQEDYLAVEYHPDPESEKIFKPDANNIVLLPPVRLYPAAKVILQPDIETAPVDIYARWKFARNDDLYWFEDFCRYVQSYGQFVVNHQLLANKANSMQIPAGINIQIRLMIAEHEYGRDAVTWLCPIATDAVKAQQGQTVNLGHIRIEREMPVYVQVVDSRGNPIRYIRVSHYVEDRKFYFDRKHPTDAEGIAEFQIPPYHKGTFYVGYRGENKELIAESITYETNGLEDANNVYTLQVSDDILYHLFK